MIGQRACLHRRYPSKTQAGEIEIELVDEHVDYANPIIFGHVIVRCSGSSVPRARSSPSIKRFILHP